MVYVEDMINLLKELNDMGVLALKNEDSESALESLKRCE